MANLTDEELLEIVNNMFIDKHIITDCNDFVSVCYNLFYNTDALDVTFTIGNEEFTIPNMAKNTGILPIPGESSQPRD